MSELMAHVIELMAHVTELMSHVRADVTRQSCCDPVQLQLQPTWGAAIGGLVVIMPPRMSSRHPVATQKARGA